MAGRAFVPTFISSPSSAALAMSDDRSAADANRIERAVLERIRPSSDLLARVARVREELVRRFEAEAARRGVPLVRAVVAGSAARETFVNGRLDIDLFLLYPPDTPREVLEREGLALGGAVLERTERRYAEHPYVRGEFSGFRVEAVPGYAIDDPSKPISAVDRTPFHHAYLSVRQTPEMKDQVRLTKQFLRTLGLMGSDVRTGGFSGYLVELLMLEFGTLDGLLRAARDWPIPVRVGASSVDPRRLPGEVALVLIDPVDPGRNVSSALTRQSLGVFILAAREYLRAPSARWFEPPPPRELSPDAAAARVARRGTTVAVVEMSRPANVVDDTLYPQLRKAERALRDALERAEFTVVGTATAADADRLVIAVEVASATLPAVVAREGPPPGLDRSSGFLERWDQRRDDAVLQGPYVAPDGHLRVETVRKYRTLDDAIAGLFEGISIGKDLIAARSRGWRATPLSGAADTPALREALVQLLDKRFPWRAD